ncbi:MAG: ferritin-like protein [Polyangiaceae bacterium]
MEPVHPVTISDLLSVPKNERGPGWLRQALQSAIELEHATLPPYLLAYWSIDEPRDNDVKKTVWRIMMDEMWHMGLACNLLTTIGGDPRIHHPQSVPRYPGPLPGGVRPWLSVVLAGFSKCQIERVFLEIEMPEKPLALMTDEEKTYPTIGMLYDDIREELQELDPRLITGRRQIVSMNRRDLFAVRTKEDAINAVDRIQREGEGTHEHPYSDPKNKVLAHYYAFKQIFMGRELVQAGRRWVFAGKEIPFPKTHPVAPIPFGGYPQSEAFDKAYTAMLSLLHQAWNVDDGQPHYGRAVGAMKGLNEMADKLVKTPREGDYGNYGPSFVFRG